jgi:hypothetical protein
MAASVGAAAQIMLIVSFSRVVTASQQISLQRHRMAIKVYLPISLISRWDLGPDTGVCGIKKKKKRKRKEKPKKERGEREREKGKLTRVSCYY